MEFTQYSTLSVNSDTPAGINDVGSPIFLMACNSLSSNNMVTGSLSTLSSELSLSIANGNANSEQFLSFPVFSTFSFF